MTSPLFCLMWTSSMLELLPMSRLGGTFAKPELFHTCMEPHISGCHLNLDC